MQRGGWKNRTGRKVDPSGYVPGVVYYRCEENPFLGDPIPGGGTEPRWRIFGFRFHGETKHHVKIQAIGRIRDGGIQEVLKPWMAYPDQRSAIEVKQRELLRRARELRASADRIDGDLDSLIDWAATNFPRSPDSGGRAE